MKTFVTAFEPEKTKAHSKALNRIQKTTEKFYERHEIMHRLFKTQDFAP